MRAWNINSRDAVVAASGQGKVAWKWFNEIMTFSFEQLAYPGEGFVHLDDKFGAAVTNIATGDVAQDIYNRTRTSITARKPWQSGTR